MAASGNKAQKALAYIDMLKGIDKLADRVHNKNIPPRDSFPIEDLASPEGKDKRLAYLLQHTGKELPVLTGKKSVDDFTQLRGNIENFIGMTQLPTGIIGPLLVLGTAIEEDVYVPLATSEGALVASYHRGAKATRLSGGITSICVVEGVQRSPVFCFNDMGELAKFLVWGYEQRQRMEEIVAATSRYAKLDDIRANVEGNHLMVTLCTQAICKHLIDEAPGKPHTWYLESNYSGDKKATALSFSSVRGKKVAAECLLPRDVVKHVLKTTPEQMAHYWQTSTLGVIQSGAIGAQGHVANGLTALFIATGQDAACIAEAATGITRMQLTESGDLYTSVTLPNLIVGTVGGGTGLPTQQECLNLLGCTGPGTARRFAEICGAVALSGEISIAAALAAGHFAGAHQKLGRKH
jgi:hydroxymethylglutaryl-CoA reductase (NADPH)